MMIITEKPQDRPLLIIDGYGFVFRAYHVQPPLVSPEGQQIGAIYGLTSMLIKLINDFKPNHAVFVLDGKSKNFRHQLFPGYKAHRPPAPEDLIQQLAIVHSTASALGFATIQKDGFEADDLIATLAVSRARNNQESIIISSDKDLLQLMSDKIKIYDPVKLRFILEADVLVKFGVLPSQVREIQSLIGDSSDNIPGVKGIGPKTAAELINNFGSLKGIYASINQVKNPRHQVLLREGEESAFLSWQLVGLVDNVDIPMNPEAFTFTIPEKSQITEFLTKYGFKSLYKRIENLFEIKIENYNPGTNISCTLQTNDLIIINNEQGIEALRTKIEKYGIIGVSFQEKDNNPAALDVLINVDNQTYSLNYLLASGSEVITQTENLFTYIAGEPTKKSLQHNDFINEIFTSSSIKKLVVNLKEFYKKFPCHLRSFEDLSLMEYCISAGKKLLFVSELPDYIKQYHALHQELFAQKALHLYTEIDLPLCHILHQMEQEGIKIDIAYLRELSQEFQLEIEKLEQQIFTFSGQEFNIASPKQLGEILFNKLKLPFSKVSSKTRAYNTSAEVLEKLSEEGYKIADLLLRYRQLAKLKNTYTDTLPKQADSRDHRIHTTFLQSSTTTGRLSSHDPNVQNIPIRTQEGSNIRRAFIAKEGHKLISADYSQIELRILSHVAKVAPLREAFIKGKDIHQQTASQIFGVSEAEVTPDLRRSAKAINFGIIYGISAFGLARNLNIDKKAAADYIQRYFAEYPGIEKYMQDTVNFAREHLYVENTLGRRCYVPMINNKNNTLRSFAERAAINAPMQSLTADIAKMAMIAAEKKLRQYHLRTKMLLQIHDELVFEAPIDEIPQVIQLVKSTMENVITLDVPLKVDVSYADNWQET